MPRSYDRVLIDINVRGVKLMNRIATICLGIGLASSAGCASATSIARQRLLGKTAPDFALPALDGETVRLSDSRGKPVLLAFWAYG